MPCESMCTSMPLAAPTSANVRRDRRGVAAVGDRREDPVARREARGRQVVGAGEQLHVAEGVDRHDAARPARRGTPRRRQVRRRRDRPDRRRRRGRARARARRRGGRRRARRGRARGRSPARRRAGGVSATAARGAEGGRRRARAGRCRGPPARRRPSRRHGRGAAGGAHPGIDHGHVDRPRQERREAGEDQRAGAARRRGGCRGRGRSGPPPDTRAPPPRGGRRRTRSPRPKSVRNVTTGRPGSRRGVRQQRVDQPGDGVLAGLGVDRQALLARGGAGDGADRHDPRAGAPAARARRRRAAR